MRSGESVVGALVVVAGGPDSSGFGEAERRVLATFANQAALAVERGQQEEQRNRALALQETDRLRTALLNSVSHDLRTPLASIKASASSLLDREVRWSDAERDEFLATINTEVDRLTRLVHNLLDMSRIEAGALDPHLVESSVAEVVGPVVRRARAASRQRVDVDVPDELPPVLVDPVRLDQVLTNLLDNARSYAAAGPVQVVRPPGRRHGRAAGGRPRSRHPRPGAGARVRPVLPAQGRRQAARGDGHGPGHLPGDRARRTAAASGSRPPRGAAPASCSPCPSRRGPPRRHEVARS